MIATDNSHCRGSIASTGHEITNARYTTTNTQISHGRAWYTSKGTVARRRTHSAANRVKLLLCSTPYTTATLALFRGRRLAIGRQTVCHSTADTQAPNALTPVTAKLGLLTAYSTRSTPNNINAAEHAPSLLPACLYARAHKYSVRDARRLGRHVLILP